MILIYLPFALQGLAMMFDEFYFHHQRRLGLWERMGHPLDTLTVLICYIFLLTQSYSDLNLKIFIGLSAFSCLFITKDEFVHTELCGAQENWLHALLFVLHPLSFLAAALIWKEAENVFFLQVQAAVILAFMIYQITYWSLPWKKQKS